MDDKPLKSEVFFTDREKKLESANALSIYSLSPGGQSYFKNIRVCNDICSAEASKNLHTLSGASLGYSLSVVASMSALYFALLA